VFSSIIFVHLITNISFYLFSSDMDQQDEDLDFSNPNSSDNETLQVLKNYGLELGPQKFDNKLFDVFKDEEMG